MNSVSKNAFMVLDIIENGPYTAYVKQNQKNDESLTVEGVAEDGFYQLKARSKKRRRKKKEKMNRQKKGSNFIRFEDVFTLDNMVISYKRVRRGKTMRRRTVWYQMAHLQRLRKLLNKLRDDKYQIGKLSRFRVYEPKEREVVANQFEDKIVQDVLSKQVLCPLFMPVLIHDNYASQPGKGSHMALGRLERFMRIHAKSVGWTDDGWVLMGDIRKFFYMINHAIYWKMVQELPIDDRLKGLLKDQIDICTTEINPYTDKDGKGLCIGFETSQWSAVYYLNKFDHFIKETLGIKCYGRYMDDFYIIHKDRKYLEWCLEEIRKFLKENLDMDLNKKTYIHPFSQGICFLGYHVYYNPDTHEVRTEIRKKSINSMLKRAKKQYMMIHKGQLDTETAGMSLQSWHAYAVHGETEKVKNAYEKAKDIIHVDIEDWVDQYHRLCDDWDNLDEDDFFRLQPRKDTVIRDVDGFAILMPQKKSKSQKVREIEFETVKMNEERYVRKNLTALLSGNLGRNKRIRKGKKKPTKAEIKAAERERADKNARAILQYSAFKAKDPKRKN